VIGLLNFDGSIANANQQEHLGSNPQGDESTVMGKYKTLRYASDPSKIEKMHTYYICTYYIYMLLLILYIGMYVRKEA
jgi:hypothetical protein